MGWVTAGLYLVAAFAAFRLTRAGGSDMTGRESRTWAVLSILFVGFWLNKQFDLMSALTEGGRAVARAYGWYGARTPWQRAAVFGVLAVGGLSACGFLVLMVRRRLRQIQLASLGTAYLAGFIAIRNSSLHEVDGLLSSHWHGIRLNWVFELGGIALVLCAVAWRTATLHPRPTP